MHACEHVRNRARAPSELANPRATMLQHTCMASAPVMFARHEHQLQVYVQVCVFLPEQWCPPCILAERLRAVAAVEQQQRCGAVVAAAVRWGPEWPCHTPTGELQEVGQQGKTGRMRVGWGDDAPGYQPRVGTHDGTPHTSNTCTLVKNK